MNTQICIDGATGQDCLEFTRTGTSTSKGWKFVRVQTFLKAKNQMTPASSSGVDLVNQGLFYVNQSAYGQMI